MNEKLNQPRIGSIPALKFGVVSGIIMLAGHSVWAQTTPPVLNIARSGTNQLSITITNAVLTDTYEVWWTPALENTNYPWTMLPPGTVGQTNFIANNWGYPAVFFQGVLDPYAIPLWENATPSNPGTNILKITIASPANGAVLQ